MNLNPAKAGFFSSGFQPITISIEFELNWKPGIPVGARYGLMGAPEDFSLAKANPVISPIREI